MPDLALKDLGAAFDRLGTVYLPALMGEIRQNVSLGIWHDLASGSPVGSPAATGPHFWDTPRGKQSYHGPFAFYGGHAGDPHPGKYRASQTFTADPGEFKDLPDMPSYGIPGDDEVLAVLAATPIEDPVYAGNRVPGSDTRPDSYAPSLEAGHSPQAPEGVYEPTVEEVGGRLEDIGQAAVTKIEAMIG